MKPERKDRGERTAQLLRELDEQPMISYEWEELLEKLSSSDDPRLREIGLLESEFLKMKRPFSNRK